jgi:hypothetical protein
VTLALLVAYWQRSLADLWRSIRPIYPTPAEDLDAPF